MPCKIKVYIGLYTEYEALLDYLLNAPSTLRGLGLRP